MPEKYNYEGVKIVQYVEQDNIIVYCASLRFKLIHLID